MNIGVDLSGDNLLLDKKLSSIEVDEHSYIGELIEIRLTVNTDDLLKLPASPD